MTENPQKVRTASRLTASGFEQIEDSLDGLQLIDVRNPGEFKLGTIPGATPVPVSQLPGRLDELDKTAPTIVFCAGGYRSSVAASLLRQKGFDDVSDIIGGYAAWSQHDAERNAA
jgi:rhodanese-related sulfurtransferase